MPIGPNITLSRKSGKAGLDKSLGQIERMATFVGIPAANASRRREKMASLAGSISGTSKSAKKKAKRAANAAAKNITNAEILFVNSKGSMLRKIPARPVLEPAIAADDGAISHELGEMAKAVMANDMPEAKKRLKQAGIAGQNAARAWITDPRNGFAPNSPRTVKQKGSAQPMIDWGIMRAAITHVEREE